MPARGGRAGHGGARQHRAGRGRDQVAGGHPALATRRLLLRLGIRGRLVLVLREVLLVGQVLLGGVLLRRVLLRRVLGRLLGGDELRRPRQLAGVAGEGLLLRRRPVPVAPVAVVVTPATPYGRSRTAKPVNRMSSSPVRSPGRARKSRRYSEYSSS